MSRKKTNPHRIPANINDYNLEGMKFNATMSMVFQEWAIILTAIASFSGITAEHLQTYWAEINNATTQVNNFESTQKWLSKIQDLAGCTLPLRHVNWCVRTKADIRNLQRRLLNNAQATAFAMLFEAMITHAMMKEEDLRTIIQKTVMMNEEIDEGRISVQDLVDMLEDEYSIKLEILDGKIVLHQ